MNSILHSWFLLHCTPNASLHTCVFCNESSVCKYIYCSECLFTPLSEETIDYKTLLPPHYGRGEKRLGLGKCIQRTVL